MREYLNHLEVEAQEAYAEAQRLFAAYEKNPGKTYLKVFAEANRRHAQHLQESIDAYTACIQPPKERSVGTASSGA